MVECGELGQSQRALRRSEVTADDRETRCDTAKSLPILGQAFCFAFECLCGGGKLRMV